MTSKDALLETKIDVRKQDVLNELHARRKESWSGIYYLVDGDEIVYVGQSIRLFGRVLTHIKEGNKRFDGFVWSPADQKLLNRIEAEEIINHRPKYNQWATLPPNDSYMTIAQIRKRSGKSTREIKKSVREKNATGTVINGIIYYRVEWTTSNADRASTESQPE